MPMGLPNFETTMGTYYLVAFEIVGSNTVELVERFELEPLLFFQLNCLCIICIILFSALMSLNLEHLTKLYVFYPYCFKKHVAFLNHRGLV